MARAQHFRKTYFSLIELLVVIVIMTILLGIAAPAFRKLTVGNSVDAGARMVSSQLMLARAEAISRRQPIAVIMPAKTFTYKEDDDDNTYHFQAFRSAFVEQDSNGDYVIKEWVPGTQWNFLPNGATIARVENDTASSLETIKDPDDNTKNITAPKDDWAWGSDGSGSGIETVKDSSSTKLVDGSTNNQGVRAVIFEANGHATKKSVITIMEGLPSMDGSTIDRPNKKNIRVMEVNRYTGQVSYLF